MDDITILDKIKQNSELYADRLVMVEYLEDIKHKLTWRELDDYSDILANWLDSKLKTKIPVIVYGHKHPMMIVCFIACVKSGRAYCPVDVNVPDSRVEAIIKEVNPEIILTTESLEIDDNRILSINDINDVIENNTSKIDKRKYISAQDTFYIIFTSGSTGTPKGVQITRECLDNFIKWALTLGNGFCPGKHYTFLNQAPFSFDLSVMDLFLCLYTGGTLWSLPKEIQSNSKMLYESLKNSCANIWVSTPSFADVCLSDPCFNDKLMPCLTDFLFCGEILTNRTVDRLYQKFPNSLIVNTYGPTESTCAITGVTVTRELNETAIPLPVGIPKEGTWIRILDDNGVEQQDGQHGEIVIVGDSVSIGYWNNETLNKEKFGITKQNDNEYRYYRTGDDGYLSNGMLFYNGRIDLQVKLHGYRIELGDIENNLIKINGIEQAVVIAKYRDGKASSLAAGVVYSKKIDNEKEEIEHIKNILKDNIPEYMVPKKIKFLSSLPRTNNGKIDRKAVSELL